MKPPAFDYARPDTVDEALALLAEYGPDATVLAGGMSLGAMLNMRLVRPGIVVDLNRLPNLDEFDSSNGTVSTGTMMRQATAMTGPALADAVPMLALALPHVGHYQTRNRGTMGGSVAHADPSAEIPLCLLAAGGWVALAAKRGTRRVGAEDFFRGILSTDRAPDELITELFWPRVTGDMGDGFAELAQRHGDFAIAAAAARVSVANGSIATLRFALGGIEDRPRLIDTEKFLGAPATEATSNEIAMAAAAMVEPVEDLQADAAFRRHLVGVLGTSAIDQALANARPED